MHQETNTIAIGIDLGTTYSCVSVYTNGKSIVIPNENGNNTTPSWVSFDKETGTRYVGESAKAQRSTNPTNTIYDVKRLMGQYFDDVKTQQHISTYPYKVIKNEKTSGCLIEISIGGEKKYFTPEEISAMILSKLKQQAQNYLEVPVVNAVITVPAYFNDSQRQATKDAGTIAGLNVLRIINEPTSASIAYGFGFDTDNTEHKFLVYDMGGGTLDVSVLNLSNGVFRVIATDGNGHLGGEDFDNCILQYVLSQLDNEHNIKLNIGTHPAEIGLIRTECEKAKRLLASCVSTKIIIDWLDDDCTEYKITLSRQIFESISDDLFKKALEPVERVLSDSKLGISDIEAIVLVGGSTRLTKIQQMLSSMFNKELCKSINPDEAVSIGSSIGAAILTNGGNGGDIKTSSIVLLDVCPLTLGVETSGEIMTPMILRNTQIPCVRTQTFTTHVDNQTSCEIHIYEGERKLTKYCNLLGKFELSGLRPMKRGEVKIDVVYELDANGILKVSACEKAGGMSKSIVIKSHANRLSSDEIERLIEEAKNYEKEDYEMKKRVETFNQLEKLIYHTELSMKNIDVDDSCSFIKELADMKIWIEEKKDVMESMCVNEIIKCLEKFENSVHEFFSNAQVNIGKSKHNKIEQMLSKMTAEQREHFEKQLLNQGTNYFQNNKVNVCTTDENNTFSEI